jgi:hypothetical protein
MSPSGQNTAIFLFPLFPKKSLSYITKSGIIAKIFAFKGNYISAEVRG